MAKRDAGATSWLAVLLGLITLGAFAFLAGGLVGILWKEPGLLFAYLRGDTTEISWSTASQEIEPVEFASASRSDGLEGVAPEAAAPIVVAKREPIARASADSKPERAVPTPHVAAAPPTPAISDSGDRIAIQVGAFAERSGADRLRKSLMADGFPAYLAAGTASGNARWRVRVGPYPAREEAETVAAQLKRTRELPTWVLDADSE